MNTKEINHSALVDFIVEIDANKDPVILQLTDTQIIDAARERFEGRLNDREKEFWATDLIHKRCYDDISETIHATQPDFIFITGDLVYGEFDDNGVSLINLIEFMDSFQIPWAPVFGNHDNESKMGVDWQSKQLENAKYGLFKQRQLTGNGNYSVGITQGGDLKRVFFMLDSNSCNAMSDESFANGHSQKVPGFGQDQIAWYTEAAQKIKAASPNIKLSFAFHVQLAVFEDAYKKYGLDCSQMTPPNIISAPINIDYLEKFSAGDFGYIGRGLKKPWDTDYSVWNGIKALGADSIFVGHEHCNSASVLHDGVRFQYGQKIGAYDRANFVREDGSIYGAFCGYDTPISGGTVMTLSKEDGSIIDAHIYLCGDTQEKIARLYNNK